LIVSIGVDNDIRPQPDAGIQPPDKRLCQALILGEADDVVDTMFPRNFRSGIRAAVIYDKPFNFAESCYFTRKLF
jgi:hypothetical protein